MNLKRVLTTIANIVADEAHRNADFRLRLEEALAGEAGGRRSAPKQQVADERRGGRRTPAILDPVDIARSGENGLRARLTQLDLDRLHDVVAEYGMDPGKLVMKWKDRDRVIDRIVEVALARATKGDAFRAD